MTTKNDDDCQRLLDLVQATLDELLCVRDYVEDASRGQLLYRGSADISEMAGGDLVRINETIATGLAMIAARDAK